MPRTIYFDYNATTPLDPAVREAMLPFLGEVWGNPSSVHHVGRQARALLDEARDRCARVLVCKPNEIVFTSGGTESNNLAIFGAARRLKSKGRHLITSSIEHHAVLHCCEYLAKHEGFDLTVLPVDRSGLVSPDDLVQSIRADTILVSIMAANNEIGTIQPVAELGGLCRERGVVFHTDTVQWFGKEPFTGLDQFNADLVSVCAHKFHGPKGTGLLYVRSPLQPDPTQFGGAHENERRAGTENLAAIIGLTEAVEQFVRDPVFDSQNMWRFTNRLALVLKDIPGVEIIGSQQQRLANTLAFVVQDSDSVALLAGLDLEGICASSGSACSAGSLVPSHVVSALGYEQKLANALVRFSLGRGTTMDEVEQTASILPRSIRRVQRRE
ncbi:MAG: cysteine desulfurase [Verrucomicrobia bacterium]|nr:cysteine desulfurase [Verrucomicrobiota bacterium]